MLALVLAMAGGAWAAKGVVITKLSQIKPSVQKQLKGAAGPQGAKGESGPAGPTGPTGPSGSPGKAGDSVTTAAAGAECEEGGTKFTVGGKSEFVCNGAEGEPGAPGAPGSPWVVGKAPGGVVMKGTWVAPPYAAAAAEEEVSVPISTGVPTSGPLFAQLGPEVGSPCTGTAENPTSTSAGVICLYPAELVNFEPEIFLPSTKLGGSGGGAVVNLLTLGAGTAKGYGSWALLTKP